MDKEILANYRKACKIAAQALEFAKSITKKGVSVLEICELFFIYVAPEYYRTTLDSKIKSV